MIFWAQDRSARLRSCHSNHKDLVEEFVSEASKDAEDGGLEIYVTGSRGGKRWKNFLLFSNVNPRYSIGNGSKEAWNKLADDLEAKVEEHLKNKSAFCGPRAGCLFCNFSTRYLNLKVKGHDGDLVHFKIKRMIQLRKLMETYCARQSLPVDEVLFHFKSHRLFGTQTPKDMAMENDDVIDATLLPLISESLGAGEVVPQPQPP